MNSNEFNTTCRYTSYLILFALWNKINCKFQSGLFRMSKVYLKLNPFPAANESLPNHKHEEGVTYKEKELVEQEDGPAVSTLHNKQTNCINSNHLCISVSFHSRNTNYKHQTGV